MAQAISLNGNSTGTLNDLYEKLKPGFESLLGNAQDLGMGELTPSSMEGLLQKFNTAMDGLSVVKGIFQGDIPEVMGSLSSLSETFLEKMSDAAENAQDMVQELNPDPEMSPAPMPG